MAKFFIFVHASAESESGRMPTREELTEMGAFNAELAKAGTVYAAEGLLASSTGARVAFSQSSAPVVTHGPFALGNLVAGLWFLELESLEVAIEWAKKIPFKSGSVEVRKVAGEEDFGDALTDEMKAKRSEWRK